MKSWPLALAALLVAETAAIACSCMDSDDPAELRKLAGEVATNAIAMVEVETTATWDESKGAGDRMRVIRTLVGNGVAPSFRVARRPFASSASCDLLFEKGQRDIVLLFAAESASAGPSYRISGLCTAHLLDKPVFRDEVARLMTERLGRGERG